MHSSDIKIRSNGTKEPVGKKTTEGWKLEANETICEPKYVDDITLFMAWHNWYLYHQNYLLSNVLHAQYQHMSNLLGAASQRITTTNTSNNIEININTNPIGQRVGYAAKLAPLRKRIAAEIIDFFLLLLVKLFVITYCLGEDHIDRFQYLLIIDENTTIEDLQATLIHAILLRLVAVAYEGYCISGTLPLSNGSTLGKRIMGLQVVKCEVVEELDIAQEMILVIPGNEVGTLRSLLRATLKNAIISLFFPMLLPFHTMANHNRLIYDIAIGTIVVEKL